MPYYDTILLFIMKFSSVGKIKLQRGSCVYRLFGKRSKNPLSYSVDLTGHEIVGEDYALDRQGYYTYLVNFTVRGSAVMEYNGQILTLSPGDLTIIDCNLRHKFTSTCKNWEFYYLHCDGPALPALYEEFRRKFGYVMHGFRPDVLVDQLSALHEELETHSELTSPDPIDVDERLFSRFSDYTLTLLNDLWMQMHVRDQNGIPPNIARVIAHIHKHYTQKITLDELASLAFLSPWRLSHLFKRYTGTTVGNMINELRLRHAIELLTTTQKKIIDVAMDCGYTDSQMLKRLFKQSFSMTPKEYREAVRQNQNVLPV